MEYIGRVQIAWMANKLSFVRLMYFVIVFVYICSFIIYIAPYTFEIKQIVVSPSVL